MTSQRHRRCAVACQNCRERKVRCSVSVTGVPCAGCTQDGVECNVRERLRRRKQHNGSHVARRLPQETLQVDQRAEPSSTPLSRPSASLEGEPPELVPHTTQAEPLHSIGADRTPRSITERYNIIERPDDVAERTGIEISSTVLGQDNRTGHVPFYTGITPTHRVPPLQFVS
ncbi:hypothetical protein N7486_007679 [Penicillium sp. IBT 16267x]|nr:hypothetical protein N7486_007679 [Penicillium sp. IBT 16267x]